MDFTKYFATRLNRLATPQAAPMPETTQLPNSAGGYAWAVDHWVRLDRFLVLGSEDGTFYVGERELTLENAAAVLECLSADGMRTVARLLEVGASGRAARNDSALFALALAAEHGDTATRAAAFAAMPGVARTGTHLFQWLKYLSAVRGWGRGVRRAVAAWYAGRSAASALHQVLKYPGREGWTHRDALRLAHPRAATAAHDTVYRYAVRGWKAVADRGAESASEVLATLEAVQGLKHLAPADAARVIAKHRLTREMVPTALLRHAVVWEALLERMPLTAMVRNLGVMSKVGLLAPDSDAVQQVVERLADGEALRAARVHPLALLVALKTYGQGHGMRGKRSWQPDARVVDALDRAFYLAFENVRPSNRRVMLALDVSASMSARVMGMPYLSCREASAAMALVTAAREPFHMVTAFTTGNGPSRWGPRIGSGLSRIGISPRQRLDDVVKQVSGLPFGGTDCALPMLEATRQRWPVDLFVIYTDSETWAGAVHPAQALRDYRRRMGIAAKLVVVGMASNGFSIADPDDRGMMDVVGFDTATPMMITDFCLEGQANHQPGGLDEDLRDA